jgi:hypothetical protein
VGGSFARFGRARSGVATNETNTSPCARRAGEDSAGRSSVLVQRHSPPTRPSQFRFFK